MLIAPLAGAAREVAQELLGSTVNGGARRSGLSTAWSTWTASWRWIRSRWYA
jgi:hypothetical protein